jgi:nickel-dependent lactate racemase
MMANFLATPRDQTRVDQWQSQILARILLKNQVIYVSDVADEIVREMQMIPAKTPNQALRIAEELLGNPNASVVAIPDGISLILTQ